RGARLARGAVPLDRRGGRRSRVGGRRPCDAALDRATPRDGLETAAIERGGDPRRGGGRLGIPEEEDRVVLSQRIYRASRLRTRLGLWGSLVYPSGFGTLAQGRRACDGSSNLPSPIRPSEGGGIRRAIEGGIGLASQDGGEVVQRDLGPDREEAPHEGGGRRHDPHGPCLPVPLGRRGGTEG